MPMHSFHRFSQMAARQNLSMYKANRAILIQRNNLKRFMIHGKLTASRVELADDKAVRNRGRCRGSGPEHPPPKKVGLENSRLIGSLEGREAVKKYNGTMGDLVYRNRKGGSANARKGLAFT